MQAQSSMSATLSAASFKDLELLAKPAFHSARYKGNSLVLSRCTIIVTTKPGIDADDMFVPVMHVQESTKHVPW